MPVVAARSPDIMETMSDNVFGVIPSPEKFRILFDFQNASNTADIIKTKPITGHRTMTDSICCLASGKTTSSLIAG